MVKAKDLVGLGKEDLTAQIVELKQELAKERATIASGTKSENPGKIRKIRRNIARVFTVLQTKEIK
ncbi:MAG: 50S ribosomal protein L29 [archaeon]|jgi:large subunit ribosomal protein L29